MQRTLSLLIFMGQFFFPTCLPYEYHFIEESKSWDEARMYCRENYTDLATVSNMADLFRLSMLGAPAWIGLYRRYRWSSAGVEMEHIKASMWKNDEPNDSGDCVWMAKDCLLGDNTCDTVHPFICVNETEEITLIDTQMNWTQAQGYCREHHKDLISGRDQLDKLREEDINLNDFHWTGLSKDPWRWSDGSKSDFRHWKRENSQRWEHGAYREECAVSTDATWDADDCNKGKPFLCYDDEVVLVKQEKTWEEALYYCRDHHSDLATITNHHQQRWVQARAKHASTSHVWLGLRYTCTLDFWFWVSGELVSYDNWGSHPGRDDCDFSGAMAKEGDKWFKKQDDEKFNFICSRA